jgi:RNA polymerase sigma-70 factor (ECF subfamily)
MTRLTPPGQTASDDASNGDQILIRLVANGQPEALAQLYDRYRRLVISLALAIVGDLATAEEVTLDVFMRVWQKAGTYRADRARVSTWLTHITRNQAIDVLRRRGARADDRSLAWDELTNEATRPADDPQELAEQALRRERVRLAVSQLPREQRQALALAYFRGYSQSDIARLLDQPLGTVKTRIRLAMRRLRSLLADEMLPQSETERPAYNKTEEPSRGP